MERQEDGSYLVKDGWVTNCQPGRPKWRLKAARAKIRPGHDVRLHRSTFVLGGAPILYSPFAMISIAEEPRQSGFLLPGFGNDSDRGFTVGTAFFWAINPHADLTVGGQFFNQGGWTQTAEFRARPSTTSTIDVNYFGAIATPVSRPGRDDLRLSGQSGNILAAAELGSGWRGVLDIGFLSSFRFRQAFAVTFNEAVRSEVRADAFLTNNPDTFYFNGFVSRFQDFFRSLPETSVTIFTIPGVEFGTRPYWLDWIKEQPIYFSFDSSVSGMRRDDPRFQTPEIVQRYSVFPRLTIPLRWGRYFGITPSFGVRASRYSSRLLEDPSQPGGKRVVNDPLRRITQEVSVDLRFPSWQRIFDRGEHKYKHVVEPEVTYRYVNGVRSFEEIIRFDENDILTDTHEVEYGLTQRLFVKESSDGHVQELLTWRVSQKYFFDPDLRGAIRPGQRNVVDAFTSITPFAFADEPRRFSPIVSVLKFTPGGRYDVDFRVDFDTDKSLLANSRIAGHVRLTDLVRVSIAHFTTRNDELLQPKANEIRTRVVYGRLFRPGLNAAFSFRWNLERDFFPNQVFQASYNWDCCGVGFSFRRLGIGTIRGQNEFRFFFTVANVGTFGTIEERQRIF